MVVNGEVHNERHNPELPQVGGKRAYDLKFPTRKIIEWLTIGSLLFAGVNKGLDWLAARANVGTAAKLEALRLGIEDLRLRDSLGQLERERLLVVQAAQAQQIDTVKAALVIFAEQACDPRRREALSLGARARCRNLFGNGR